MISRLRARHRLAWLLAAGALVTLLCLALALRPEETLDAEGLERLRSLAHEPAGVVP